MTGFKEDLTELLYNWDMSFTGNFINELEKIHLLLVDKAVEAESENWEEAISDLPNCLKIEVRRRVAEIREGK